MRYCVTGATGFLGGDVARQLVAAGHHVVAVVRTPAKATALADLGVSIHHGDVTDKESLRAPMTGADGVFHIAGWYKIGVRDTSPGMAVNVAGTRHTLEMMHELGIPKASIPARTPSIPTLMARSSTSPTATPAHSSPYTNARSGWRTTRSPRP